MKCKIAGWLARMLLSPLEHKRRIAKSKKLCYAWAKLEPREWVLDERHCSSWEMPWAVELYGLHRWAGSKAHWNCYDAGSAYEQRE